MSDLQWDERNGWGFLKPDGDCKTSYWDEYQKLDDSPMGRVLTALRCGMVGGWSDGCCVDVGIGGGAFCKSSESFGADVDEKAIEWLKENGMLWDEKPIERMTFWDSIEHILDPHTYLRQAISFVFLSTPIYNNEEHCRGSKHLKPNEHIWYFTDRGIKRFMEIEGFKCLDQNALESDAGREGIGSYAFRRA